MRAVANGSVQKLVERKYGLVPFAVKSDSRLNNVSECMKRPCLIPNAPGVQGRSLMDFRLCGQTVTDSLMLINGPTQSFSHSLLSNPH